MKRTSKRKAKRPKRKAPEPSNTPLVAQLLKNIDGHAKQINFAHSVLLGVFRDDDDQPVGGAVNSLLDNWMWPCIKRLERELTELRKALGEPADDGKWIDDFGEGDDDDQ